MSAQQSPASRSRRRPTPLACYQCRRKHLKCDGTTPVCDRCASAGTTCTYLPSRRGLSGRQQPLTVTDQQHNNPFPSPGSQTTATDRRHVEPRGPAPNAASAATGNTGTLFDSTRPTHSNYPFSAAESNYLVGLYYSHFHRSHPMLVPRAYFAAQQYPDFLVLTTCLVGHHFASSQPSETLLSTAVSMVESTEGADSTCRIQALIMLALVFLGSHEMDRANDCICHAVSLATEAKLDSMDAHLQSTAQSLEQESLRRTWWELFTVDALLALLQGRPPKIRSSDPNTLPSVPCAEILYETSDLTRRQPSYAEFERRFFLQPPGEFCSHFYRIEAVITLRRVQPFFTGDNVDPQELEAVRNAIASWSFHLPDSSFDLARFPGEFDHMLLQAHLLVQVASIFLHFPRSSLPSSSPSAIDVTCLGKGLRGMQKFTQHGIKSMAASRELCHIASIPFLHDSHSPMVVCGFLLGSAVQISAASACRAKDSDQRQQCRDRAILMLGALRYVGNAWSSGRNALHHIQPFADLVFGATNDHSIEDSNAATGSGVNAASGSPGNRGLERMTGEQYLERNLAPTLQDNLFDINWFDFFQSVDPSTDLPVYDTA